MFVTFNPIVQDFNGGLVLGNPILVNSEHIVSITKHLNRDVHEELESVILLSNGHSHDSSLTLVKWESLLNG